MISGDSSSRVSVMRPCGKVERSVKPRDFRPRACGPRRESTFGSVQLGDSTWDILSGFRLDPFALLACLFVAFCTFILCTFTFLHLHHIILEDLGTKCPKSHGHQSRKLATDITRLWNTFRPVDRTFPRLIIGDLPLLADSPIDWTLLRTAISFWDTQRAVFSFQGTELAPTVEEYAVLIQRPMLTRDIVVFRPSDRDYTDWIQFFEGLIPAQFLWAARWNPGSPMAIGCPSADVPDAESSVQGAVRTELQSIREEQDRLRCELVDNRAELIDHRELQRELAQTRARIANQDREIAHLNSTLDRAWAKARRVSHP
ncbi:hypothetical protein CRG98_016551 [Punica granatum]|uniref:Aminotransferase-like plant mobile domain-containing protein n=1 Tax=Punica granatum TaxID=22663 RepID=A0A2I0K3C4_PUNGR|nr:hypothetical protein CRG98_016551 [Punica granatum]